MASRSRFAPTSPTSSTRHHVKIMSDPSIADYALLSDCHSAALVSRFGSVDWLCAQRFDGSSVFGRLLDPAAGHWSLMPDGGAQISRATLQKRW